MSKQMTPCEKLGYKVGDKFTVIKDSYFEKGTIVALSEDDGGEVPWFTCGCVRRALIIGSNPDVEPTPSKLKPAKQALADAIHQSGGWMHGAEYAAQDKCAQVTMFRSKPIRHGNTWLDDEGFDDVGGFGCDKIQNWHQTVLRREEYYQAYPKADAGGWIEWKGGECPVDGGDQVDYKLLSGSVVTIGEIAGDLKWSHEFSTANIIAYRLHKPEVKPEFCESVMHGIPEQESIDGLCAKVTEENKHQHVDATTIEQLAHDYRNKLDFANSKQQEADDAKVAADAALGELERAGEALGLLIGIAKPDREPELVITDW